MDIDFVIFFPRPHQDDTLNEICKTLVSGEAIAFIDNHDKDTPMNSIFPSKTITIAEMIILHSKFGTTLTANIIGKVVSSVNVATLREYLKKKISFVKNWMVKRFNNYTEESRKEFLLSPYRTSEGNLKKLVNIFQVLELLKLLLLKKWWFLRVQLISFARSLNLIADTSSVSILVIFLVCWSCWGC